MRVSARQHGAPRQNRDHTMIVRSNHVANDDALFRAADTVRAVRRPKIRHTGTDTDHQRFFAARRLVCWTRLLLLLFTRYQLIDALVPV
jgi:hypothetical protein